MRLVPFIVTVLAAADAVSAACRPRKPSSCISLAPSSSSAVPSSSSAVPSSSASSVSYSASAAPGLPPVQPGCTFDSSVNLLYGDTDIPSAGSRWNLYGPGTSSYCNINTCDNGPTNDCVICSAYYDFFSEYTITLTYGLQNTIPGVDYTFEFDVFQNIATTTDVCVYTPVMGASIDFFPNTPNDVTHAVLHFTATETSTVVFIYYLPTTNTDATITFNNFAAYQQSCLNA